MSLSVAASRDFDIEPFPGFCGLHGPWAGPGQVKLRLLCGSQEGLRDMWAAGLSCLPSTRERQRRGHVLLAACSPAGLVSGATPRLGSPGRALIWGASPRWVISYSLTALGLLCFGCEHWVCERVLLFLT